MFCNKCGAEVDATSKFCNKCGATIEGGTAGTASIVFRREGSLAAALVPTKVFLDNNLVGSLGVGEEMTITTTVGKHRVDFNVMGGNGGGEVEITSVHPNVKVLFKVAMGMITAKPKIISIQNLD